MKPDYVNSVFINCPFDEEYNEFFIAIVFAVYACGFYPRSAKEENNGLDTRIDKILRIIKGSKYGIHDISRTTLDAENNLPRFNMPFELGLFFAAKKFGNRTQKLKSALVFEENSFSYQKYISDLNGIDIKAHKSDVQLLIKSIRQWLRQDSDRLTIPGENHLLKNYTGFAQQLPYMLDEGGITFDFLSFSDLCNLIEEWLNGETGRVA